MQAFQKAEVPRRREAQEWAQDSAEDVRFSFNIRAAVHEILSRRLLRDYLLLKILTRIIIYVKLKAYKNFVL